MKTLYIDPLVPLGESIKVTLQCLSGNIRTLTGLIGDAERTGHLYLAELFFDSRDTKVADAKAIIALLKEENANTSDETAGLSLATEREQQHDAADEDWKQGEQPPSGIDFLPAQALLLMDVPAAGPERRFLLVGLLIPGSGALNCTSRRPRRERGQFTLMERISSIPSAYSQSSDPQAAWVRQRY